MELTCPKCQGAMRHYERSGVVVDQCADCRGIFLDRGELERLVDAENAWHGASTPPGPARQAPASGPAYGYSEPPPPDYRQGSYGTPSHGYPRKRKKSFLDELFD